MTIPKIIHYCWFGPNPIPELEKRCIQSWKKYFPEYKLMLWNEASFDLANCQFAQEAYEKGYYAFVSDYVRSFVLYQHGGIYLDTDVEVLKNFENFLEGKSVVLGFENQKFIGTAFIATIPQHDIFKKFSEYYLTRPFLQKNGDMQIIANPTILRKILKDYKIDFNNTKQVINDVHIYPREWFFPKKIQEKEYRITNDTYTIHYFQGSWLTERQKRRGQNKIWIEFFRPILRFALNISRRLLGKQKADLLESKIRNTIK